MHEGTARSRGEVTTHLLALAGPELYTRNAFRVTSLPADAGGPAIRHQRQRLNTLAATGDEQAKRALAAVEELRDARHRIAHELFTEWRADPKGSCGCSRSLHMAHNLAVGAHATALRLEGEGRFGVSGRRWSEAAVGWTDVLSRAAFWDHVRHRIKQLGDRRMGEATVAEIREVLPRVLATSIVELAVAAKKPGRLVRHAAAWNFGVRAATDLLADAVTPLTGELKVVLDDAGGQLDAGKPVAAARALLDRAVPKVHRLEQLVPHADNRDTARARDDVAVLLNNCALAAAPGTPVQKWFDTALGLVVSPAQRTVIENNAAEGRRVKEIDADLARFGLTVADGGFETLGKRLTKHLEDGRYAEARQILTVLRKYATDAGERRTIDQLLTRLDTAKLYGHPWQTTAPEYGYSPQTTASRYRSPEYTDWLPPGYAGRAFVGLLEFVTSVGWLIAVCVGFISGIGWGLLAGGVYLLVALLYAAMRPR